MHGRSIRYGMLLGMLVAAMGAFSAGGVRADEGERLWAGAAQLQGVELPMTLKLTPTAEGSWTGTMAIPSQGFDGVAVAGLVVTETSINFTLPFPGMPEELIPSFELTIDEAGTTATGSITQGEVSVPVTLRSASAAAIAAEAAARRPQSPRGPFPYRTVEIRVPVAPEGEGAHEMAGTLALPDPAAFGEGPYACVVLLTGSGPQDRDETIFEHKPLGVIADALARAGVASLRCDDRGFGESGGDSDSYDFATDALAEVEFARQWPGIDSGRVGLLGHSEGGLTAAMVAADHPEEVAFVVSLAGMGLTGRETLLGQAAAMIRLSGAPEDFIERNNALQIAFYDLVEARAPIEEQIAAMRALVLNQMGDQAQGVPESQIQQIVGQQMSVFDSPWMKLLLVIDPAQYLRRVRQPVLVMNGELDVQVLPDENVGAITKALEAAGNERVTVRRFPGLNHLFQNAPTGAMSEYTEIRETIDPAALQYLVDWVVGVTVE